MWKWRAQFHLHMDRYWCLDKHALPLFLSFLSTFPFPSRFLQLDLVGIRNIAHILVWSLGAFNLIVCGGTTLVQIQPLMCMRWEKWTLRNQTTITMSAMTCWIQTVDLINIFLFFCHSLLRYLMVFLGLWGENKKMTQLRDGKTSHGGKAPDNMKVNMKHQHLWGLQLFEQSKLFWLTNCCFWCVDVSRRKILLLRHIGTYPLHHY